MKFKVSKYKNYQTHRAGQYMGDGCAFRLCPTLFCLLSLIFLLFFGFPNRDPIVHINKWLPLLNLHSLWWILLQSVSERIWNACKIPFFLLKCATKEKLWLKTVYKDEETTIYVRRLLSVLYLLHYRTFPWYFRTHHTHK